MKKLLFAGMVAITLSSCTITSYMSNDLSTNYQVKMSSKKERVLVEKIPIYLSEKEIPNEFTVKSINSYSPLVLPVIGNRKKIVLERLYKKAVKTAGEQRGDAVLIVGEGQFKVILLK